MLELTSLSGCHSARDHFLSIDLGSGGFRVYTEFKVKLDCDLRVSLDSDGLMVSLEENQDY